MTYKNVPELSLKYNTAQDVGYIFLILIRPQSEVP
jgi:hypothetical protein